MRVVAGPHGSCYRSGPQGWMWASRLRATCPYTYVCPSEPIICSIKPRTIFNHNQAFLQTIFFILFRKEIPERNEAITIIKFEFLLFFRSPDTTNESVSFISPLCSIQNNQQTSRFKHPNNYWIIIRLEVIRWWLGDCSLCVKLEIALQPISKMTCQFKLGGVRLIGFWLASCEFFKFTSHPDVFIS